jgi:uncharacterized membrane protein YsdA (DUF1294 family)
MILKIIYPSYLLLVSLIALILYINDKNRAIKGKNRIQEKTLLEVCVLGGAIGAFIGRIIAHHKTDKKYFSFIIYLNIILEIVTLLFILIK